MTPDEARLTIRRIQGYWPGDMGEPETLAWMSDLTGDHMFDQSEVRREIVIMKDSGATYRPRPGQVVRAVLDYRRRHENEYRAIETPRSPRETAYYWLDKIRADNKLRTKLTEADPMAS